MSLSQQSLFSQKYITIATDISCDPDYKITTWACYIRHDGGAIKHSGRFKNYPKTTMIAETYALINAITIASKLPDWSDSRIIIHNEIACVLDPIKTKNGMISLADQKRAKAILTLALPLLDTAQSWERRKIKAHFKGWKKSDNPRKYAINRWCDTESRRLMREIRKGMKKVQRACAKGQEGV
jgi:ribonuclease HI